MLWSAAYSLVRGNGETECQQLGIRQLAPGESGNTTVVPTKSGMMITGGHIADIVLRRTVLPITSDTVIEGNMANSFSERYRIATQAPPCILPTWISIWFLLGITIITFQVFAWEAFSKIRQKPPG